MIMMIRMTMMNRTVSKTTRTVIRTRTSPTYWCSSPLLLSNPVIVDFHGRRSLSFTSSSLSVSWFSTTTTKATIYNADTTTNTNESPSSSSDPPVFRVAIVGSGPSGCYTAKYLLNAPTSTSSAPASITIDMFERLPTLYGLVRNGVAPDHPEVKNVQNDFDTQLFSKKDQKNDDDDRGGGGSNCNGNNSKSKSNGHTSSTATATDDTAATADSVNRRINLFANVTVGKDLSLGELREHYDAVVLASGCESDRSLPGIFTSTSPSTFSLEEDDNNDDNDQSTNKQMTRNNNGNTNLLGVLSARQFVNWYNGHPEYDWVGQIVEDVMNNKKSSRMDDTFHVVVIGHGNVALDCARVIAKTMASTSTTATYEASSEYSSSSSTMVRTDIATRALDVLGSNMRNQNSDGAGDSAGTRDSSSPHRRRVCITVVGRRGHIQAAFTIKEIRELTKLNKSSEDDDEEGERCDCEFVLDEQDLHDGSKTPASQEELKSSRPRQRIDKLLRDYLKKKKNQQQDAMGEDEGSVGPSSLSEVRLRFLMNPIRVESRVDDPRRLGRVICERTELVGDEPGHQKAQGTGEEIAIDADLCLVSIGYRGVPIPGTEPYFDFKKGIINNIHGRVLPLLDEEGQSSLQDSDDDNENNRQLAPLYVSGWLKRGPSGIIGTNIPDAKDTVASILHDLLQKVEEKNQTSNDDGSEESSTSKKKDIKELLKDRNVQIVDWDAYQRIDDYEQSPEHKRHPDQPREKVTSESKLLEIAASMSSR